MTLLASHRQRRVVVEVFLIWRSASLDECLDDRQRSAPHRVVQGSVLVGAHRVHIGVELSIVLVVFVLLVQSLLLLQLVVNEHLDLLVFSVLASEHQGCDSI